MFQKKKKNGKLNPIILFFENKCKNDFFFVEWQNKSMRLICQEIIGVLKENFMIIKT